MGPSLVRIVFYFGAAVIVLLCVITLLLALMTVFSGNFGGGLMQFIAAPIVAAVVFVYWRFLCELFMIAFRGYDRLCEVRDLMRVAAGQPASAAPAPDPDHPAF